MLNVLLLLAVTVGLVEGLDDQRGGSGDELDGSLTVLDDQLDGDADSLPFLSGLSDIISDLLGGKTEGTNLGGKSGSSSGLTSDDANSDYRLSLIHTVSYTALLLSEQDKTKREC